MNLKKILLVFVFLFTNLWSCTGGCLDIPAPPAGAIALNAIYTGLDTQLKNEYKDLQDLIKKNITIDEEIVVLSEKIIKLDTKKAVDTEFSVFLKNQLNMLTINKKEN